MAICAIAWAAMAKGASSQMGHNCSSAPFARGVGISVGLCPSAYATAISTNQPVSRSKFGRRASCPEHQEGRSRRAGVR
jgi:hypothetical protein